MYYLLHCFLLLKTWWRQLGLDGVEEVGGFGLGGWISKFKMFAQLYTHVVFFCSLAVYQNTAMLTTKVVRLPNIAPQLAEW